jgi:hypothetical protein
LEIIFDAVVKNFIISYTNDPVFDILPEDRNVLTYDSKEPWILISVGRPFRFLKQIPSEKYYCRTN